MYNIQQRGTRSAPGVNDSLLIYNNIATEQYNNFVAVCNTVDDKIFPQETNTVIVISSAIRVKSFPIPKTTSILKMNEANIV